MTFKPGVVGKCDLKKGIVTTTHYWERPVTKKFDEWVILVREYINMHSIKVNMYVCGKYLENPNLTWDVDVVLSYPGEIDYVLIRNLMNYGMQLGFDKFDMLVDMAFYIPSCEQIMENLFLVTKSAPSEKHITRIENGEMYMKPVII
jgi:hypothetical protein